MLDDHSYYLLEIDMICLLFCLLVGFSEQIRIIPKSEFRGSWGKIPLVHRTLKVTSVFVGELRHKS